MEEIETLGTFRLTGPTGQRQVGLTKEPRERVGTKSLTELIARYCRKSDVTRDDS